MSSQNTHSSDDTGYVHGSMDIAEHVKTWLGFWNGAKWGVGFIIFCAILLAIFRTHNG